MQSKEDKERLDEIMENWDNGVYDDNVWTKEDIAFLLQQLYDNTEILYEVERPKQRPVENYDYDND